MTDEATGVGDESDQATGAEGESATTGAEDDDAYGGLFGALPYAFRASDSLVFKSYAVTGTLLSLAVTFLFGMALVVLLGETTGVGGGTFSFSRAFFVLVGLFVVVPLLAPILFVARRHRRGVSSPSYDKRLAALGYVFVSSLYVALLISIPEDQQEAVTGVAAPLVEFLYSLPSIAGLLPPLLVAVLILLAGRAE